MNAVTCGLNMRIGEVNVANVNANYSEGLGNLSIGEEDNEI